MDTPITHAIVQGDYDELETKTKQQLLDLYKPFVDDYIVAALSLNDSKQIIINTIREAIRLRALGELKQKFKFTDDFKPLDIIDDRSISQKILDGDLTMDIVKSKRMVLYAQVSFDQIVYLSYNAVGTRRGDRHTVLTRYQEIGQKAGQEVELHEIALPLITKVVLSR